MPSFLFYPIDMSFKSLFEPKSTEFRSLEIEVRLKFGSEFSLYPFVLDGHLSCPNSVGDFQSIAVTAPSYL